MIREYIKLPVTVQAIQWTGDNCDEVMEFCGDWALFITCEGSKQLQIITLEGVMMASVGDYIVKGVDDEYYPCKPHIFDLTYKLKEENE